MSTQIKVTRRNLKAWNHHAFAPLMSGRGISFNENWNVANGLPNPETRQWLHALHDHLHGICGPNRLTWAEVQAALK